MSHNETDSDRVIEDEIAARFASNFGCTQHALPEFSRIDRVIFSPNGSLRGFFEVKRRHHECGRHNTYSISLDKFEAIRWIGEALKMPVMLVIQFDDIIAWIDITKLGGVTIRDAGRDTNKDAEGGERVVHIPIDRFQFIVE